MAEIDRFTMYNDNYVKVLPIQVSIQKRPRNCIWKTGNDLAPGTL